MINPVDSTFEQAGDRGDWPSQQQIRLRNHEPGAAFALGGTGSLTNIEASEGSAASDCPSFCDNGPGPGQAQPDTGGLIMRVTRGDRGSER